MERSGKREWIFNVRYVVIGDERMGGFFALCPCACLV
jgi:hypothetical protein